MKIKHTDIDFYKVRYFIIKYNCWWTYKTYSTKQSALCAIKRLKDKYNKSNNTRFQVIWCPYAFCELDQEIIVYEEEEINE